MNKSQQNPINLCQSKLLQNKALLLNRRKVFFLMRSRLAELLCRHFFTSKTLTMNSNFIVIRHVHNDEAQINLFAMVIDSLFRSRMSSGLGRDCKLTSSREILENNWRKLSSAFGFCVLILNGKFSSYYIEFSISHTICILIYFGGLFLNENLIKQFCITNWNRRFSHQPFNWAQV